MRERLREEFRSLLARASRHGPEVQAAGAVFIGSQGEDAPGQGIGCELVLPIARSRGPAVGRGAAEEVDSDVLPLRRTGAQRRMGVQDCPVMCGIGAEVLKPGPAQPVQGVAGKRVGESEGV